MMTDQETGDVHLIKADRILFNFREDYLTATGNITYMLQGTDKTENFIGDKLTFNVNTWEGLFSKGQSEEQKDNDGEDITFYFKGELINKTADNYVILEKGEITSCDMEDPHFKLKAEKIWLLAGDEWAMVNGILYIGRIPVLYIPGFLNAGDEIFFNPVFGYRDDFGYYLQTTTYLIGKKQDEADSPFSFMQSGDEPEYSKVNGLYLTADDNPAEEKKEFLELFSDDDYYKLMLDLYSSRGVFICGTGEINKLAFFSNLDLYTAFAITRKIEQSGTGYTHLFLNDNNEYGSIWETSFLYNIELPFRYGIDLSFNIDLDWLNFDFVFQSWSDSTVFYEFSDRSESLDLLGMLNPETASSSSSSSTVTSGSWEISADLKPSTEILKPFISSFSIENLKTSLTWKQKDIETGYDNSTGEFFYPDNYIFPGFSASISGKLLSSDSSAVAAKEKSEDGSEQAEGDPAELIPPWGTEETSVNDAPEAEENTLPDMRGEMTNPDYTEGTLNFLENSLGYSISPVYSQKTQLNSTDWVSPDDINFSSMEYTFQSANLSASLSYQADFLDDFLSLNDSVKFTGKYSSHYNMSQLSQETIDKHLLEDKQSTSMDVSNNLSVEFNPLKDISSMSGTRLSYIMNSTLYNYDYSTADESFITGTFDFTEEYISSHKIQFDYPLDLGDYSHKLSLTSTLPPIDLGVTGSFAMDIGPSSTKLSTSFNEVDGSIVYNPLTIYEKLTIFDSSYLSNSLSYNLDDLSFGKNSVEGSFSFDDGGITFNSLFVYDFEEDFPSELSGKLKIYGFYVNFAMLNTYNYVFDTDSGWLQQTEKSFQPSELTTGFLIDTDPLILWKNRINLDFSVDADIDFDLIQFSDSIFSFDLNLELDIFEFLTLSFKTVSQNKQIFRYISPFSDITGMTTLNVIDDLLKSFNFFNIQDRYDSNFNLKSITIGLSHDLHDWDLNIDYTGYPEVNTTIDPPQYEWTNELNIYLKWKAVEDIKSEININRNDISF